MLIFENCNSVFFFVDDSPFEGAMIFEIRILIFEFNHLMRFVDCVIRG